MTETENNYEVYNVRGDFDISFNYEFTNKVYSNDEGDFEIGTDNFMHDLVNKLSYKYMIENWVLKGFMVEYVISHITDLSTRHTSLICGYRNEVNGDIINECILLKDNNLYIKGDKLFNDDSYIIVKPKHYKEVKIVNYNNKHKPYIGTGTMQISSETIKLYTGHPIDNNKLEECTDLNKLREFDIIIECISYLNLNILITHNIYSGRLVSICEYDEDSKPDLKLLSQYMITNRNLIITEGDKENDMSYMQYIDDVLYIFLDIDYIKDDIEIIDGFGDKIGIEKVTKLFKV